MIATTQLRRSIQATSSTVTAAAAALLTLGLLAGCSGTNAPNDQGNEENTADGQTQNPADQAAEPPSVWLLGAPTDFATEAPQSPPPADTWVTLMTGKDGCTLTSRGAALDEPASDMKAASTKLVEQIAEEGGGQADSISEVELVTQGAGEGNDPSTTAAFISGDWSSDDTATRTVARVMNLTSFSGESGAESLAISLTCPGNQVDSGTWDAVVDKIRPVMHAGSAPDDPWGAPSTQSASN